MSNPGNSDDGIRAPDAVELLAHALELTHDSIDRYRQLQDCLEVHHNPDAALLLARIVDLTLQHAAQLSRHVAADDLPKVAPWDLQWRCPSLLGGHEPTASSSRCDHLISPIQVLQLALGHERCAQGFYLAAITDAASPEAAQMLETIARLQAQQIARLEELRGTTPPDLTPVEDDLDPPQRPE